MMAMEQTPVFYFVSVFVIGLLIGSFLNVVIYRFPIMMENLWKSECASYFPDTKISTEIKTFNLFLPRSSCPECSHTISALENIPVISWLLLKGRCNHCHCKISARYPCIELLTAVMSLFVAWFLPFGWPVLYGLAFTWCLIALTFIDIDKMLLPDQFTLSLLWLGILVNLSSEFIDLESAILGAVFGYLSLWSIYWGFKLVTGKEGMGHGDFKLFAALGAWFGWQALPLILLLSSFVAAIVGVVIIINSKDKQSRPLPFGPYLASAGWIYLIYGSHLATLYYSLIL
jgi:leader peptidase (prepilin peptidase)/N-methyltransferase